MKIEVSTRKHKKYAATLPNGKVVHFGDKRYQQYKDKIGKYAQLDHGDLSRKEAYYKRHGKEATLYSAKWFAHKYLW